MQLLLSNSLYLVLDKIVQFNVHTKTPEAIYHVESTEKLYQNHRPQNCPADAVTFPAYGKLWNNKMYVAPHNDLKGITTRHYINFFCCIYMKYTIICNI